MSANSSSDERDGTPRPDRRRSRFAIVRAPYGPAAAIGSCAVFRLPRSSTMQRLRSATDLSTSDRALVTRWCRRRTAADRTSRKAAGPQRRRARPSCGSLASPAPASMSCCWTTRIFCAKAVAALGQERAAGADSSRAGAGTRSPPAESNPSERDRLTKHASLTLLGHTPAG